MAAWPDVIGFDAKRAVSNMTGLGNYSRLVISVLSQRLPQSRLLLYTPRLRDNARFAQVRYLPNIEPRLPQGKWRHAPSLWRVWRGLTDDIRRDGVTLFHGLSNELPLDIARAGVTSVVTIHDLIFRHYTDGYKAADRAIYDLKFRHAAQNATRIIAISEATRRDIIDSYGIDPGKIDVVYQGCHEMFGMPVSDEMRRRVRDIYRLPERYVVSVGTVEPRKNQMLTLKALRALPADVGLVIVGHRGKYARELDRFVRRHHLGSRVTFLEGVPMSHLPALYALAQASAYTSRIEGFGIPVIESVSAGTPVVAATGTCLEEAGGPGALYVSPDDPDAAADALLRILDDPQLRARMVADGRTHVARFSNDHFADGLLATYIRALTPENNL